MIIFIIYNGGKNNFMISNSYFSFAGCNGTDLLLFNKKIAQGYQELYYSAPYHWAVVNIRQNKIITYTEGDITEYICKNKEELLKEISEHINYLSKYGYNSIVFSEGKNILQRLKRG